MTTLLLERAVLDGVVRRDVLVEIEGGRFSRVQPEALSDGSVEVDRSLRGLTVPGLANCHSHAFHRALRGRTQTGGGSFWTWRTQMYDVAARLTPDQYYDLARATYREMAAGGVTAVGEFHYLHHRADGTPYPDPNEMGHALIRAARAAGLRITLLDACYLSSGFGAPPEGAQIRYDDGDVEAWVRRVDALAERYDAEDGVVIGAAIHSVRAVPPEACARVAEWAQGRPLHVHLSEQVKENEDCIAAFGATPTQLLADHGVLGPLTSAVHATHLSDDDIGHLGGTGTFACFCPTTERDLGDGIGPSLRLRDAGSPLTLGSDSHAVIDLFEEMRAVELDERLATQRRGHWSAEELLRAGAENGHRSLGVADAGEIRVGARADLVTLATDSVRTAGTGAGVTTAVFAATAADVVGVIADGRTIFTRADADAIGVELTHAHAAIWPGKDQA